MNSIGAKPKNIPINAGTISIAGTQSTQRLTSTHVHELKYGDDFLVARVTVIATADVTGYGLKSLINPDGQPSNTSLYIGAGMPASVKITASSTVEVVDGSFGLNDDYGIV